MARSLDQCIRLLETENKPTFPKYEQDDTLWCNATWDGFLCWQAIPANTSFTLPCPPIRGLLHDRVAQRICHWSGRWQGRQPDDFTNPTGWTNYSGCWQPQVSEMITKLDQQALKDATHIAANARKIEFVGLTLSFTSLIIALTIFSIFKRLRVFRNQIHRQLMIVMLFNVIVRLILYIDQSIGRNLTTWVPQAEVKLSIHSTIIVCELFYIVLEYLKTVAFAFMFIEGYYLHNTIVVQVLQESEPSLWKYAALGWGIPAVHVLIWVLVVLAMRSFKFDVCLGDYYIQPEYWIMNGIRMVELVINVGFLLRVVWVLWVIIRETHLANEFAQFKKSVKGALMLIPLLGIPNIMQTIPYIPTNDNLPYFAVFTYVASFFFMYQGFMVAVLYCITNREVINVLKSHWSRYRLRHTSADTLRRGSRAASVLYQAAALAPSCDPSDGGGGGSFRRSRRPTSTDADVAMVVDGGGGVSAQRLTPHKQGSVSEISDARYYRVKPFFRKQNRSSTSTNASSNNNKGHSNSPSLQSVGRKQSRESRLLPTSRDHMIKFHELKPLFLSPENGLPTTLVSSDSDHKKLAARSAGFITTVRRWLNLKR